MNPGRCLSETFSLYGRLILELAPAIYGSFYAEISLYEYAVAIRFAAKGKAPANEPPFCHCELSRSAGGRGNPFEFQLDGHVASLLAMTDLVHWTAPSKPRAWFAFSR